MAANRQAARPPVSFVSWRYVAAFCAVLYGVLLGFLFVAQHVLYTLRFSHDFRSFESILILAAGIAVFRGASARFVLLGFAAIIALNLNGIAFAIDMLTGNFHYATGMSLNSVLLFLSTELPYAGIVAAILADPLVYRAFGFARRWPDAERA